MSAGSPVRLGAETLAKAAVPVPVAVALAVAVAAAVAGCGRGDTGATAPTSAPATASAPVVATTPALVDFGVLMSWQHPDGPPILPIPEPAPPPPSATPPPAVAALHGARVRLQGYVLPIESQDGRMTRFLLIRHWQACCFGGAPGLNEFVDASVAPGAAVEFYMRRLAEVEGRFEVAPRLDGGKATCLYRLVAERLTAADEPGE